MLATLDELKSVKVIKFDIQHKKLIGLISELESSLNNGLEKESISKLLNEIGNYADAHFSAEEKSMREYNYPLYQLHRDEHDEFMDRFIEFHKAFNEGKQAITMEIIAFLKGGLTNHFHKVDRKYSEFFNNNGLF